MSGSVLDIPLVFQAQNIFVRMVREVCVCVCRGCVVKWSDRFLSKHTSVPPPPIFTGHIILIGSRRFYSIGTC